MEQLESGNLDMNRDGVIDDKDDEYVKLAYYEDVIGDDFKDFYMDMKNRHDEGEHDPSHEEEMKRMEKERLEVRKHPFAYP